MTYDTILVCVSVTRIICVIYYEPVGYIKKYTPTQKISHVVCKSSTLIRQNICSRIMGCRLHKNINSSRITNGGKNYALVNSISSITPIETLCVGETKTTSSHRRMARVCIQSNEKQVQKVYINYHSILPNNIPKESTTY